MFLCLANKQENNSYVMQEMVHINPWVLISQYVHKLSVGLEIYFILWVKLSLIHLQSLLMHNKYVDAFYWSWLIEGEQSL